MIEGKRLVDVARLLASLGLEAKKEHDRWGARCPNPDHFDKNPSWYIKDDVAHPKHGSHYCFSCKYSGGPADLVRTIVGVSLPAALQFVDERAIEPTVGGSIEIQGLALKRKIQFRMPPGIVYEPLDRWPVPARKYAHEDRGITPEQVNKWSIGYSTEGRLRGRIVFPVWTDKEGVMSYSARTYIDSPKRYLMPSKEENADQSAVSGEAHWYEEHNEIVVCEGDINRLAVERAIDAMGLKTVATGALLGSHISLGQILRLSRFHQITVLTDPDYAGDTAAKVLVGAFARYGRVLHPPLRKNTDPAKITSEELSCILEKRLDHERH